MDEENVKMKLCKKTQIEQTSNSVRVIIPGGYQLRSCYSNNIGPANIIFDEFYKVTRAAFLIDDHYTKLPALVIGDKIKASFFEYDKPWRDAHVISEIYLNHAPKESHMFYTVMLAIKKTNLFVDYLNQNNLLTFKLKGIDL